LIVKIAIENQIDSKYTSFLAINERDNKVYDVPQIEETPVEHSFDYNIVADRFEYPVCHDLGVSRFEPLADRFDYKTSRRLEKTLILLENKLNKFIEAIKSNDVMKFVSLMLEINKIILGLDLNITISNEIETLIYEIKSIDEWIYNQLFNGVKETIKDLFYYH
ncbi:MAG: hypothetical protein K9L02_03110, partial [Acholeplasmataceae bacterium]|nr:hypothetical protein [Acholeplasmataceae bacterium]